MRSTVAWKAARVAPGRLLRELRFSRERRPLPFDRTELHPNLERYWQPDSDAVSWIDPHAAILWFVSRGDRCLSHPTPSRRLTVRTGGLVFRIGG